MSQNNIESLLAQGIDAARSGDRRGARDLLEQVVELDQNNEKAWFWLASVVDTDEERRMCLRTVLKINPKNEKARAALSKIEERLDARSAASAKEDEEVAPGVKRQPFRLLLMVGGALVLIVLVFVVLLVVSDNNRRASEAAETAAAIVGLTATQVENTAVAQAALDAGATETAVADSITQTAIALVSPTPSQTPTSGRPTLPPTWTPTGLPTATPTRELLPFVTGATGRIIGWGSTDLRNTGYLPILQYDLNASSGSAVTPTQIGDELGETPRYNAAGVRIAYPRYNDLSFDSTIESINLDTSQPEIIDSRWVEYLGLVADAESPAYIGDTDNFVVTARATGSDFSQLFLIQTDGVGRLSNAALSEFRDPDVSPDGQRVVATRIDRSGAQPVSDLVILNVADAIMIPKPQPVVPGATLETTPTPSPDPLVPTPTPTPVPSVPLTPVTNNGVELNEAMPRFSPDGNQIYFAAASAGAPENHDIYIIPAVGGEASVLVTSPGDDIYPVPSPDGLYLAFASNRTGVFEIYILELATNTLYQLTNSDAPDYPGDWVQ